MTRAPVHMEPMLSMSTSFLDSLLTLPCFSSPCGRCWQGATALSQPGRGQNLRFRRQSPARFRPPEHHAAPCSPHPSPPPTRLRPHAQEAAQEEEVDLQLREDVRQGANLAEHLAHQPVGARQRRVDGRAHADEAAGHRVLQRVLLRKERDDARVDRLTPDRARGVLGHDARPHLDLLAHPQHSLFEQGGGGRSDRDCWKKNREKRMEENAQGFVSNAYIGVELTKHPNTYPQDQKKEYT